MINIKMLKNNNIITLDSPGKNIIKSSSGLMFHSPHELLCVALGSCIGRHMVVFCSQNNIDIGTFESVTLDFDKDFWLNIQHPKELTKELRIDLINILKNCEISKLILPEITISFNENKPEFKPLKANTPCCGG